MEIFGPLLYFSVIFSYFRGANLAWEISYFFRISGFQEFLGSVPPLRDRNYVGPAFASLPGNEAHALLSGGRKWGVLGEGQKFMLKKIVCLVAPSTG